MTIAIAALLGASLFVTQEPTLVTMDARCTECSVHLTKLFTVGGVDDPANLTRPNSAAITSHGELVLSHPGARGQFFVYASDGSFKRAVGRVGSGPGEFMLVRMLRLGAGDTLYVFDNGASRISVFDPAYTFVRSGRGVSNSSDFVPVGAGFIVGASVRTPDQAGYPLHEVGASGITRSFGERQTSRRGERGPALDRALERAPDGSLWAAHASEYRIDRFDADGRLVQQLVRRVEWFQPHTASGRIEADQPPMPRILDIALDEDGLLQVLIRVADPEWKKAVTAHGALQGRAMLGFTTDEAYYDSIIEVIDPRTARVVASSRTPMAVRFLAGRNTAVSYREVDGAPFVDVWRVSLPDRNRK